MELGLCNRCRDHALRVLLAWLFNRELRWVAVFPHRLWPVQYEGWRFTVSNLENDGIYSRVLVEFDMEAMSDAPPQFTLDLSDLNFKAEWNIARVSEAEFKKIVRLDFKLALLEAETNRLKRLKIENESNNIPVREFERQLASKTYGSALDKKFETHLASYMSVMKAWKGEAKNENSLVEITHGPRSEHLCWLALYQVPDVDGNCIAQSQLADLAHCLTLLSLPGALPLFFQATPHVSPIRSLLIPELVNGVTLNTDAVRKGIYKAAKLIGLEPRNPRMNAGRPRGSTKKIEK